MAIKKYANLYGMPIEGGASGELKPAAPVAGTVALYSDKEVPCVVMTEPKTGAGLPFGTNAEQYVVDLSPGVWELPIYANGAAINPGDRLLALITAATAAVFVPRVGYLMNTATAIADVTVDTILYPELSPVVHEIVGGSSIASGSAGVALVMFGA